MTHSHRPHSLAAAAVVQSSASAAALDSPCNGMPEAVRSSAALATRALTTPKWRLHPQQVCDTLLGRALPASGRSVPVENTPSSVRLVQQARRWRGRVVAPLQVGNTLQHVLQKIQCAIGILVVTI